MTTWFTKWHYKVFATVDGEEMVIEGHIDDPKGSPFPRRYLFEEVREMVIKQHPTCIIDNVTIS